MTHEEEIKRLELLSTLFDSEGWPLFVEIATDSAKGCKDRFPFINNSTELHQEQGKYLVHASYAGMEDTIKQTIEMLQQEMKQQEEDDRY